MSNFVFVTGNQDKADYMAKLLGMPVDHQKVDLDEIQSAQSREVVEHKVRQAYEIIKRPVIVDDVSLECTALGGLPGPLVKWFVDYAGLEAMCRMLDGFDDRSAIGKASIGYFDGSEFQFFEGSIRGNIAKNPRGSAGYGWDTIFEPSGYDGRTRAELSEAEYDELYRQIRPLDELKQFLLAKY